MLLRIKLLIWIKLYAFKYNIIKKRSMWKNHRHSSGTVHRFYYVLNPGQISVYLRNSNQFAHFNMGHVIRLIFLKNQNYPNCRQYCSGGIWDGFQNILCSVFNGNIISAGILLPYYEILLFSLKVVKVLYIEVKFCSNLIQIERFVNAHIELVESRITF